MTDNGKSKAGECRGFARHGYGVFCKLIRDSLMTRGHLSKDLQVVKKLAMKQFWGVGEGEFQAKGIIDVKAQGRSMLSVSEDYEGNPCS